MFAKNEVWKRASIWTLSVALLVGVLGVLRVHGRTGTAAISVMVTDASGGTIAGAKITAPTPC